VISPPIRKVLAVVLLVAAVFAAWELVVRPIAAEFAEHEEAVEQNEQLLARFARVAASRGALEKERDRLRGEINGRSGLLAGNNPALVGAGLQDQIKGIVSNHGGRLQSAQILQATSQKEFTRVSVRVVMTSEVPSLQKILYDIETATPYLFVDDVDVRKRVVRRPRQQGRSPEVEEQLTVRLTVFGYVRS
jgi:general secretion pathway protein M